MSVDFHSASLPLGIVESDAAVAPATSIAFTEGPAADTQGRVFFTDMANNRIMRWDTTTGKLVVFREPSGRANGLLFDAEGRLLACEGNEWVDDDGNRRVTRTNMTTGEFTVLADRYEGKRLNAPNDIAACSNGYLFFTDPCYHNRDRMELDHDSVYRISPDGDLTRAITQPEIQRPNGIALSPDEKTLYLVDSCPIIDGNRKIWAFDLAGDGELSNQRAVIDFAPGRGGDGMAVDQEGTLYIAAGIARPRGPHETTHIAPGIYVVTPEGELRGRIPIPEDVLTNVTFGGDDLRSLYITAGKTLFTVRVAVPGFVVHRQ